MQPRYGRVVLRIATAIVAVSALVAIYRLYAGGNAVLALACAGGVGLAFFVYTAPGTYTYRYLFPGLAGIAMFIVLPLGYTVWIGFTNRSSSNLLTFERATDVLLGEVFLQGSVRYEFTLHDAPGGFRIVLQTGGADEPAADRASGTEPGLLDEPPPAGAGSAGPGSAAAGSGSAAAGSGSAGAGPESPAPGSGSAGSGPAGRPPTTFITGYFR